MDDKELTSCKQAESDCYAMTLTQRLDRMENLAQETMFQAKDNVYTNQELRDLFGDARRIVKDVERLREADISFSDALMILMLRELRNR